MKLEPDTSTVVIAGRRFPAVCVICPPLEGCPDAGTDHERMLGGHGGPGIVGNPPSDQVYIPCENGAFVAIEVDAGKSVYTVSLHARACHQEPWDDTHIWVPYFVGIVDRELVAEAHRTPRGAIVVPSGVWRWDNAEPEWTAELIDRVNRMPFTQPAGPQVRLIPIAEAFAGHIADQE